MSTSNYFRKNSGVIEMYFSYDTFKKLQAGQVAAIHKLFSFDRDKKAWVGKSPEGLQSQHTVALGLGLSLDGGTSTKFATSNFTAPVSKPAAKFAALPQKVDYPEIPEQNLQPGRALERISTSVLISSFENEGRKSE